MHISSLSRFQKFESLWVFQIELMRGAPFISLFHKSSHGDKRSQESRYFDTGKWNYCLWYMHIHDFTRFIPTSYFFPGLLCSSSVPACTVSSWLSSAVLFSPPKLLLTVFHSITSRYVYREAKLTPTHFPNGTKTSENNFRKVKLNSQLKV